MAAQRNRKLKGVYWINNGGRGVRSSYYLSRSHLTFFPDRRIRTAPKLVFLCGREVVPQVGVEIVIGDESRLCKTETCFFCMLRLAEYAERLPKTKRPEFDELIHGYLVEKEMAGA